MNTFQTEKERQRAERTRQVCERYKKLTRDYPEVYANRRMAVVGREVGLSTQRVYQILVREKCYTRRASAPKAEKRRVGEMNDVDKRFFQAFQALLDDGSLRTEQQFTRLHGINRWSFGALRKSRGPRIHVSVGWLGILVQHYGISARWLLTGEGNMRRLWTSKG